MNKKIWGQLLSIDLYDCDREPITNKKGLGKFCLDLCKEIDMVPYGKPIVKRFGDGDLEGNTAVQLIQTSNITVHCDEIYNRVFIDIFSCKKFSTPKAKKFCRDFFKGKKMKFHNIYRG
ncbi:S-adenosylmethionine decarboxylase [Patescibacteria group bacterium]|nr:S-adenosylmethionine decarboxylase [Patescibacteria group bacterium]